MVVLELNLYMYTVFIGMYDDLYANPKVLRNFKHELRTCTQWIKSHSHTAKKQAVIFNPKGEHFCLHLH